MILILKADLSETRIRDLVLAAEERGCTVERLKDTVPPCVQVTGCSLADESFLRGLDGVEEAVRIDDIRAADDRRRSYYPHLALQAGIGCLVLVVLLGALATFAPRTLGPPLDLLKRPADLHPEWYALAAHFLFQHLPHWLVYLVTAALWVVVLSVPAIDRRLELTPRGHQATAALIFAIIALQVVLAALGRMS
ncbi:MAG: hypothetical protein ABI333_01550 [bacterium]